MIYYFSATGNSKYVAERIAKECGDRAVSIADTKEAVTLADGEMLGIVTPVYWWVLPSHVRTFLNNLQIERNGEHYSFAVITYGSTPGSCGAEAKRIFKSKGIKLSASFSIRMPDNWTPVYDLSDPEEVAEKNRKAEEQLNRLIPRIKAGEKGNHTSTRMPYFTNPIGRRLFEKARRTSNFYVENTCIGCGLCAKKCPNQAIEIRDGKPVWIKEQCYLCLGCLHRCPKFSIQYGNGKTKQHGQYRNPNVQV